MPEPLVVRAFWDDEARVWVAESDDVPGLVAEAEDMDRLVEELRILIPQLLKLNAPEKLAEDILFRIEATRVEHTRPLVA